MLTTHCCVSVTAATEPGSPAALAWKPVPFDSSISSRGRRSQGSSGGAGGGPCDPEHCCQHLLRLLATGLLEFDEGLMEVRLRDGKGAVGGCGGLWWKLGWEAFGYRI